MIAKHAVRQQPSYRYGDCKELCIEWPTQAVSPARAVSHIAIVRRRAYRAAKMINTSLRIWRGRTIVTEVRALAGAELAQMISMLRASIARPKWVIPSPLAEARLLRNAECLSE